jgi:hypothetical protein
MGMRQNLFVCLFSNVHDFTLHLKPGRSGSVIERHPAAFGEVEKKGQHRNHVGLFPKQTKVTWLGSKPFFA